MKKKLSPVQSYYNYKYFGFKKDSKKNLEKSDLPVCKIYHQFVANEDGATNLHTYLQTSYIPASVQRTFPSNNPGASGNSGKQQRVDSFFLSSTSNKLLSGSQCAKSLTDAMVEFAVRDMRTNQNC